MKVTPIAVSLLSAITTRRKSMFGAPKSPGTWSAAARSEDWTGRRLAKAVGVSLRSVQRILELMRPRIVRSPVDICFGTQAEPCSEVTPFGKGSAITNGRHLLRSR